MNEWEVVHSFRDGGIESWRYGELKRNDVRQGCFIAGFNNMVINGCWDGWQKDGWTDGWMGGWSFKTQAQLLSIEHEIGTWWPIIKHTLWAFTSCKYLTYYCHSFILSFCKTRLFSLSDEFPQHTIPLISFSGLSIINFLSLRSLAHLFLSAYITALALLCISSAGFEAISVHDHYQTLPEEKVWA